MILRLALCVVLLRFGLCALAAGESRRVLIIHSFGRDFAPFHDVASQFRTELARQSPQPIEFLEASLEMARFDGVDRDRPLIEFLSAILEGRPPHLIVPVGAPALLFCQRHRPRLFPQVPLLAVGMDRRRFGDAEIGPQTVVASVDFELPALLKNVLEVLPRTRNVYVVTGTAPLERFWEAEIRREWAPWADRVALHWLSDQSLDQMRETVRQLPPDSVIFHGILNRDGAGIPHQYESGLLQLHEAAGAPIFGYSREQVGQGIVGGRLMPMKKAGTDAAAAGLRLLAGEPAAGVRVAPQRLDPPVYDWRELRRWGIAESALPPGSTVLFRVPGLWETHRWTVLIFLGVLASQSGLIALFFAARRRTQDMHASLDLAAEAGNVGFWERDLIGDDFKATPRWRALLDLPERGRVRMADFLQRVHPDDRTRVNETIEEAVREGRGYEIEFRVVRSDQSVRWIASRGQVERTARGQGVRTRGVSADITERKDFETEVARQRGELAHLSRVGALGVLSGSLAHELNQPLGVILSNAQAAQRLLAREKPDLHEVREILADIVSEDRRAGDVIKRLRLLLQRGETTREAVELNDVVGEVLRLIRSDLIGRRITVLTALAPELPRVTGDRIQLQQVLLNLLINACDAVDMVPAARRVVTLRTSAQDGGVRAAVSDQGCGLPADAEALFEPFNTTKRNGLGMGLAICRMIVNAHGGRVWAEPGPGQGATFHFSLPAANRNS